MGMQKSTDLLYYRAKYGGDRGSRAGCRRKNVMFLFVFVTLWNEEVCDNGNAVKQCKFHNRLVIVPLHRGRIAAVHIYSGFSMDPRIFHYGQIYTKNFRI